MSPFDQLKEYLAGIQKNGVGSSAVRSIAGGVGGMARGALGEVKAIRDMKDRAIDDPSGKLGLDGNEHGEADAARHMLIVGQLAQRYGTTPAKLLGYGHEAMGIGDTQDGIKMDLHNNQIGAKIGAKTGGYDELLAAVREIMKNSERRKVSISEDAVNPVYLQREASPLR